MGKMFNGSKWNDCVEAAQKQGKSYDVASRMCNSQKETSDDPVLGGLQVGVQSVGKFGSDVDAFLTEGAMYVNGSSWGDAEAAVVNSRQNNAVASEALVKMPQMATVLADKTTDLLGVCPGCVQKTDSEWPAIISKISNQTDRETAEQYYQQYLFFKGEWQRAKGQVANAGRESPADLMQYSTSRAASTALGNDIMQYVQTNAGGLTGDLKSAIEAETGLTGADALRANNANPLGSTVNWLRDGAVDMAKGFIGTMQITPTMNVGLEIGRYSYKFNLIKLKHNSFQIMTDLESGMGNVMPLWTNCATDDLERQFTIIEVYLYHFASEKWKDIPDIKKYLVNADGDTKLTRTTIIKASQFFDDILVGTPAQRRAALDRQITNGKGGRSMTIREITEKLAHGSVCAYAAEGLNGQKVNEYFTKLETFGSKLPGDERKRIADAIANAKDSIATTCGKGITDALAAISILNAQKLPPRYCGSGSAPASTITIPQNADGYRYEYTVSP
jgi:hypothetical protein